MLRGLLRMILYGLAFFLIYRFVMKVLESLKGESGAGTRKEPQTPPQSTTKDQGERPRDIRDARFRDLPDDTQKPT